MKRCAAAGEASDAYKAVQKKLSRAKRQLALLTELLSAGGDATVPVILEEWGYAREVLDGLVSRGFVAIDAIERVSPLDALEARVESLTGDAELALHHIIEAIEARAFKPILIHGVTGSGKTEVYLRAARRVLDDGGGVIVLVPEIGLLPQATARYRRAFGDEVAIIHSRLTGPDRFDIWERIEKGEHRVVVGPRSAVFSPVKDLRLIIVDEEQDESYKQDDKPRYHARSVALVRGRDEKLTVLLGSATPSAETLRHAHENKYGLARLPERVGGGAMPEIEIVDMRPDDTRGQIFSPRLLERIEKTIKDGHQSILFLNKRGHARYVQCNACGHVVMCKNCDVSLTFHRVGDRLKCHLCGYERAAPQSCEKCRSRQLHFTGVGTQRVELELKALFPETGVLRMDADTTSGKEGHRRILEEFSTGQYPILLGTQMVAKGHHFPNVNLVGVVSAEEGLELSRLPLGGEDLPAIDTGRGAFGPRRKSGRRRHSDVFARPRRVPLSRRQRLRRFHARRTGDATRPQLPALRAPRARVLHRLRRGRAERVHGKLGLRRAPAARPAQCFRAGPDAPAGAAREEPISGANAPQRSYSAGRQGRRPGRLQGPRRQGAGTQRHRAALGRRPRNLPVNGQCVRAAVDDGAGAEDHPTRPLCRFAAEKRRAGAEDAPSRRRRARYPNSP